MEATKQDKCVIRKRSKNFDGILHYNGRGGLQQVKHSLMTLSLIKWMEVAPIPTKEAKYVAEFLYKMMLRHGCRPGKSVLQPAGGSAWRAHRLQAYKITTAYHPQTNGLDERFNQMFKAQLQKLVNDQDDWDELAAWQYAYKSSWHDSTKCTPFLLMYIREAHLPIDIYISLYSLVVSACPPITSRITIHLGQLQDNRKRLGCE